MYSDISIKNENLNDPTFTDKISISIDPSENLPLVQNEFNINNEDVVKKKKKKKIKKLGMLTGVFIPVILNIFGVILFLRLGVLTGQVRFLNF